MLQLNILAPPSCLEGKVVRNKHIFKQNIINKHNELFFFIFSLDAEIKVIHKLYAVEKKPTHLLWNTKYFPPVSALTLLESSSAQNYGH